MRPLRVLSLFEYPSVNGGENSWLAMASRLPKFGVQLAAAAPPDGPLAKRLREQSIACFALAPDELRSTADWASLTAAIADFQPDLLHGNSLAISRRLARQADRLPKPLVGHIRDIIRLSRAAATDLNACRRLIAVSEAARRWHIDQGVEPERLTVAYNGVDVDRFRLDRATCRQQLGLSDEQFVVTTIGQIGLRKGLDTAAGAVERLSEATPNLVWLIVGERFSTKAESIEYEASLRRRGEALGPGRVRFLGYREDVAEILAASDVLLHAARQEPFGRVLLEAAAAGRPIVATDVGGTAEMLTADEHALLIPVDDVDAMLAALRRVRDDRQLAQRLASAAQQRVTQRFTPDHAAEAFARILVEAAD